MYYSFVKPKSLPFSGHQTTRFVRMEQLPINRQFIVGQLSTKSSDIPATNSPRLDQLHHDPLFIKNPKLYISPSNTSVPKQPLVSHHLHPTSTSDVWHVPSTSRRALQDLQNVLTRSLTDDVSLSAPTVLPTIISSISVITNQSPKASISILSNWLRHLGRRSIHTHPLEQAVDSLLKGDLAGVRCNLKKYMKMKNKDYVFRESDDVANGDVADVLNDSKSAKVLNNMFKKLPMFSDPKRADIHQYNQLSKNLKTSDGQASTMMKTLRSFGLVQGLALTILILDNNVHKKYIKKMKAPPNSPVFEELVEDFTVGDPCMLTEQFVREFEDNLSRNFGMSGHVFVRTNSFSNISKNSVLQLSRDHFMIEVVSTPDYLTENFQSFKFCLRIGPVDADFLQKLFNGPKISNLSQILSQYFSNPNDFDPSRYLFELFTSTDKCPCNSPLGNSRSSDFKFPSLDSSDSVKENLNIMAWILEGTMAFLFVPFLTTPNNFKFLKNSKGSKNYRSQQNLLEYSNSTADLALDTVGSFTNQKEFFSRVIYDLVLNKLTSKELIPQHLIEEARDYSILSECSDDVNDFDLLFATNDVSSKIWINLATNFGRPVADFYPPSAVYHSQSAINFTKNLIIQGRMMVRKRLFKSAFCVFNTALSLPISSVLKAEVHIYRANLFNSIYLNNLALHDAKDALDLLANLDESVIDFSDPDDVALIDQLYTESYLSCFCATEAPIWLEKALSVNKYHPKVCFYYAKFLFNKGKLLSDRYVVHSGVYYCLCGLAGIQNYDDNFKFVNDFVDLECRFFHLISQIYLYLNMCFEASRYLFHLLSDERFLNFESSSISTTPPTIYSLTIFINIIEILIKGKYFKEALSFCYKLQSFLIDFPLLQDASVSETQLCLISDFLLSKCLVALKMAPRTADLLSTMSKNSQLLETNPFYQFQYHINSAITYRQLGKRSKSLQHAKTAETLNPSDPKPLLIQGCLHLLAPKQRSHAKAFLAFNKSLSLNCSARIEILIHSYFVYAHNKSMHSLAFSVDQSSITSDVLAVAHAVSSFSSTGESDPSQSGSQSNKARHAFHLAPWSNFTRLTLAHSCTTDNQNDTEAKISKALQLLINPMEMDLFSLKFPVFNALIYFWINQSGKSCKILKNLLTSHTDTVSLLYAHCLFNCKESIQALQILAELKKTAVSSSVKMRSVLLEALFMRRTQLEQHSKGAQNFDLLSDLINVDNMDEALPHLDDISYFLHASFLFAAKDYASSRASLNRVLMNASQCFPAIFGRFCCNLWLSFDNFKFSDHHFIRAEKDLQSLYKIQKNSFISNFSRAMYHHSRGLIGPDRQSDFVLAIDSYTSTLSAIDKILNNLDSSEEVVHLQEFYFACLRRRAAINLNLNNNDLVLADCTSSLNISKFLSFSLFSTVNKNRLL
ncbi:hypothetical protein GEMRC1_010200 [Eukaryota sp. GEM-RC1]